MIMQFLLFVIGLTALTLGADWLVTGASRVASARGVSPLLVGLTIVAFGTSAPELVVTGAASLRGQGGIAVGNIMGSTVANVGLIVGLGALLRPILVHRRLLFRETPLMVVTLMMAMLLAFNGSLGRADGGILAAVFGLYVAYLVHWASSEMAHADLRRQSARLLGAGLTLEAGGGTVADDERPAKSGGRPLADWLRVVFGLALLLAGADWLVQAAVDLARHYNVQEEVIGATMVALGTSLPELASTVAAAMRGLGDIAIGNVIGSNIFNLGLVLGTASLLRPLELTPRVMVSQVVPALVFCLALIPLAYTGGKISRWEGVLLLFAYGVFIYRLL